ncbi:retrovirus-related Pol polyprotein from type-1 retrotransposable element R2 [Trichonephila clavata]|uniref:Retrovirus-related Pol polyprotein from type-1 retrotransposable element R2 n=1 Tax=Trichonephila clavata TaxID=2740835 RepID=A0A8X6GA37_TRICU|nr:retrovirus-related Pol polyprotein from type-1 retrotransposable element R2 [Trichonephila clavata]
MPQLVIPTSTSKSKKLDPISSGDPGSSRLAPPSTSSAVAVVETPEQQEEDVRNTANIALPTVLDCFVDALDSLLDVDELSGRAQHFENLVDNVVLTVQEHFRPPVVETPSQDFVTECLKSCENSAPGPDLISYKHWREIDPNCRILTKIFNICLKLSDIPGRWKCSNTILIQKSDEPSSLSDWQPISLSDTAYKLFSKCLAKKLSDWCETYEVLSPAEKGFSPFDGVIEHNFILSEHLETARRDKCERFVAWLDIANAFGLVLHGIILE